MMVHRGLLKFSTILVTGSCLTILCMNSLLGLNFRKAASNWGERHEIIAYLSLQIPHETINSLVHKIKIMDDVAHVEYMSEEQSFKDFQVQAASLLPDVHFDHDIIEVVPASLVISIAPGPSAEQTEKNISKLANKIQHLTGVEEVVFSSDFMKKFDALIGAGAMMLSGLSLILLAAMGFVIANSIHSSIVNKREEIEIYELIGASQWMIRKPFLTEAAFLGFISGTFGLMTSYLFLQTTKHTLSHHISFIQIGEHLEFFTYGQIATVLIGSALLGAAVALLCVHNINTQWAAAKRTVR